MEALADDISGATTDLVETVLTEYGDPADNATKSDSDGGSTGSTAGDESTGDVDGPGPGREEGSMADDRVDAACVSDDGEDDVIADAGPSSETAVREGDAEAVTAVGADGDGEETAGAPDESVPDPATLTETQLETLRAIHDRPEATQVALATQFDVTSASISQRVSSILGLDWVDREAFTDAVFGTDGSVSIGAVETDIEAEMTPETGGTTEPDGGTTTDGTGPTDAAVDRPAALNGDGSANASGLADERPDGDRDGRDVSATAVDGDAVDGAGTGSALADQLDVLSARLDRLDRRLEDRDRSSAGFDPALVHKVAHACLESKAISEDEELRILQGLLASEG